MYTILGKEDCKYCVKAKTLLAEKGIPFKYVDVMEDESALKRVKAYWADAGLPATVPLIKKEDKWIGGYEDLVKDLGA